ncbi:MAG: hypothetical protein E7369_00520 [Clostridiales bacterium]|nr:hypothetical protein [Clostridiales bacterium]
MGNITFDFSPSNRTEKEDIEWLRLWCEDANGRDLKRVALVGDSITEGYFNMVKEMLKGRAYVDYLATSYTVNSKTFKRSVSAFLSDSNYDIIHFNNGLHGYFLSGTDYFDGIKDLLINYADKSKIILATVTDVYVNGLERKNPDWDIKVKERNEMVDKLCVTYGWQKDDLFGVLKDIPISNRNLDGVHFLEDGYKLLAASVVGSIKKCLGE